MAIAPTSIEIFFRAYDRLNRGDDIPAILSQFAEAVMAAGTQGVQCIRVEDFALAVTKRKQLFKSLGSNATSLVSLREISLDARYTMVHTRWSLVFERGEGNARKILVDSTFIVDTGTYPFKIVVYIAHQDIMETLKERGILPA